MDLYHNFHVSWPVWVKFSVEAVSRVLLSICEFCENRWNEDHTLLYGVNEICPVFLTC